MEENEIYYRNQKYMDQMQSPQLILGEQSNIDPHQGDDYEEPMNIVFRVFEEEQNFKNSTDQLKVSFDNLEINPLKLSSFSILFQMVVSLQTKEIKDDLNILSTGSSLMSKNIVMGINKDSLFFVNFITQQGKLETMYSQMKLKRNQVYQIGLVFYHSDLFKELTLYINGTVENQVSLTQGIDVPRGYFWIGSEQAMKLFKGMVRDLVFVAQSLNSKNIRRIYADLSSNLQQGVIRTTADSVEEILQESYIEGGGSGTGGTGDEQTQFQNAEKSHYSQEAKTFMQAMSQKNGRNKKNFIPISLQKTHIAFQQTQQHIMETEQAQKKQITGSQEEEEIPIKNIKELATLVYQNLEENAFLYNKVREMSFNFYWLFTSCSLLAPPFEENDQAKLPFMYLHHAITKEKFDQYPVYAIEIDRLTKVIHYAGVQLTKEEIMNLAQTCESLKHNKDFGYYIIYDRFFLSCREATLSKEEIDVIKSSYSTDEKDHDQDLVLLSHGIHRQQQDPAPTFSFFHQLVKLVGGQNDAFKYRLIYLVAYYVQSTKEGNFPNVQRLSVVYILPETNQEVEVEGIEFFQVEDDKVYSQKIQLGESSQLKYFRVHYSAPLNQMSMISFKTENQEETFLFEKGFQYVEGKDATSALQTCPIDNNGSRLAGFRGSVYQNQGQNLLISFEAEYLVKDPEVLKQKSLLPEILPIVPEHWNTGKFQIVVNRHQDSTAHTTTHWPSEFVNILRNKFYLLKEFATRFNDMGAMFKDLFPNIELICNWDHRYAIEHFDVYIRGVGPLDRRDRQGRIFLFTKKEKVSSFMENFTKRMLKVYDEIVLIAQAYGDTIELEKTQDNFMKSNVHLFPPRCKEAQDYPCSIPDRLEKLETDPKDKRKR